MFNTVKLFRIFQLTWVRSSFEQTTTVVSHDYYLCNRNLKKNAHRQRRACERLHLKFMS
jgi:hypothetical protein